MGSRARIAAAACLVASGLWAGGVSTATAFAAPNSPTAGRDSGRDSGREATEPSGADRDLKRRKDGTHNAKRGDDRTHDGEETGNGAYAEPDSSAAGDEKPDPVEKPEEPPSETGTDAPEDPATGEQEPTPPCCRDGDKDCGAGWPWPWPWPHDPDDPAPPGAPNPSDGHGGGGLPQGVPPLGGVPGRGVEVPEFFPPTEDPFDPEVIDAVPGSGLPTAGAGTAMNMPVLVAPVGAGPGPAAAGSPGAGAGVPAGPRQFIAEPPPVRQPPAATGVDVAAPRSSYRIGYGEKLRTAGTPQIAVLALPGVIGILILTGAGGLLGYRQAKAGHTVRTSGMARFMN